MGCLITSGRNKQENQKRIIYKAYWNDEIIAHSNENDIVKLEDNIYFPPTSVEMKYMKESDLTTQCGWKGTANYYHITVNGQTCENGAWYYDNPFEAASHISKHVAFYTGHSKPSIKIKMFEIQSKE